jgi:hypothetical protein
MATVVQFDARDNQAESLLTPELKEFMDRVIVPILVKQYLSGQEQGTDLPDNLLA